MSVYTVALWRRPGIQILRVFAIFFCKFYPLGVLLISMSATSIPRPTRGRPPGPHARYRRIAESIRKRMLSKEWKPGSVLPPLRTLAREFRTGEYTVRLAVNALKTEGRIGVNAFRRLVVQAPEGGCAVPDGIILEVLTSGIQRLCGSYFDALQRGIEMGVGELDKPLLIIHGRLVRQHLPHYLLDYPLGGLILCGSMSPALIKRCEKLNVPSVLADRPGKSWNIHSVSVDNEESTAQLTRRLIELGHRHIAFIRLLQISSRNVDPDAQERERGFKRAIKAARIPRRHCPIFNAFTIDLPDGPMCKALFNAKPPVSAVVSSDPIVAGIVLNAARLRGKSVPGDLSIACWMDKNENASFGGMKVDFEEMGRRAALLLKSPRRPAQHQRLHPVWELGATVGPPKRVETNEN